MQSFIPGIGLSVVYEPENSVPAVDIVFVHGLGGHPYRTWTHTNVPKTLGGDHDGQPSPVFWPRDLLPADLPNSRILVYGYDIKVTELVTSNPLKSHIFSDSQDLLFALQKARVLNRPRIFIAHDFGGLIIKELLVRCAESEHEDIIRSTVAVIFFGTPHQGDSADLGRLVASIWQPTPSDLRQDSYGAILAVLGLTGTSLERQKEAFYRIWRKYDFRVKTFIEGLSPITSATKVPPDYCALIGDHRERPEIIEADHTGMCRFPGADDIKYRMVAGEILSIYRSITKSNAENVHQSGRIQNPMLGNISIAKIHEVVGADDHLKDDDEACIRSLWFPTMDSGRLNKQKPADRTCLWLFDHEIYQDWFSGRKRDSHNGLLWLKGKPGAGKSTLMMEAFRHTAEMEEVQSAAFFFDAKGPELNHSPVGLFRSLLYQLLPRYQEHLRQLNRVLHQRDLDWGKHEAKASSWQEKELESFFSSFALQLARPTFIFIDALDECDSKSIRKQAYFWRYITASAYRAGVQLNVCVSSSHLPFISLSNCPEIVVEQFNSRDIATFVELKLMVCTALARAERGALRDAVLGRAVGVFLWAVLVVDDLLSKFDEGYSIPQLLNQLDIVPLELETLFSSMFHSVNSEERLLTVRLFQWAVLAAKPLRLFEWHHIMAFIRQPAPSSLAEWHLSDSFTTNDDQLEKQIRYISKGLVEVKTLGDPQDWYSDTMSMDASAGSVNSVHGESRVVQVIHGSVREFFLHGSGFSVIDPSLGPHPVGKGHLSIIATCLDYINIRELDRFFEARVMAGRPGNDQRSSNEHRTSGTQSPGPQNIETHPFSLTQHDGTRKQGEGRAWEGEQPKGNMTKENLEKRKGYADAASRIDTIRQWALDTEQTSLDESARSSTTDLSITGWFEAFPALLSYATSQLFTHARLAADAGVDPRLIFSLFTEKTWERWVALSDDVPPGTQLVDYAADQGLSAWVRDAKPDLRPSSNSGDIDVIGKPDDRSIPKAITYFGSATGNCGESFAFSSTGRDLERITEDTEYNHGDSSISETPSLASGQDAHKLGLYDAPTEYTASEPPGLSSKRQQYIRDLAAGLFNVVESSKLDEKTFERISKLLPDLLRAFALKLGYKAQTQIHRDVSYFVHKHREYAEDASRHTVVGHDTNTECRQIRSSFESMHSFDNMHSFENIVSHAPPSSDDVIQPGQFAIGRYLEEPDFKMGQHTAVMGENIEYRDDDPASPTPNTRVDPERAPAAFESGDDDDDPEDPAELPSIDHHMYRDFMLENPAYSWLVASLQREAALARANPDLLEEIKDEVLRALPSSYTVSRKVASQQYNAKFELDWDPLSFVKEQKYVESPDEAIERAITLTGSESDAQAAITREYLSQTWPATGKYVMQLVADVVRNTVDRHATVSLPDGTEFDALIRGTKVIVTALGTGDSLVEIAQQLAWVGAALRSSPFEAGVAVCSPFIRTTAPLERDVSSNQSSKATPPGCVNYVIGFRIQQFVASDEQRPGHCWHKMFRNPVLVSGYPVLSWRERGLGLELPLNMGARLVWTERVHHFDGKIYIKGLSSMLIATRVIGDLIIWHHVYNGNGERISYFDHDLQHVDDNISLQQLDKCRHVVGWCEDCLYYAGAPDANYNIKRARLPQVSAGCILEKATVNVGSRSFISGGATMAIGTREVPPHITPNLNNYILNLESLEKRYVVFWDEDDKRGWLVNGVSALLHLVRAKLRHMSTPSERRSAAFAKASLFDPRKLKNSTKRSPISAPDVLLDHGNREIEIYAGKTTLEEETSKPRGSTEATKSLKRKRGYYLFEDLVEQFFVTLDQIMAHQRKAAGESGVKLKVRTRVHLEGWDFVALVTDNDLVHPRVATIDALGYGWVHFIRSINAVTLFGSGFGDIIQPSEHLEICPRWASLPKERYYLAAAVLDMENIIEKYGGDERTDRITPVPNLMWHCPAISVVKQCQCQQQQRQERQQPWKLGQAFWKPLKKHHDPVQVFIPMWSRWVLPTPHISRDILPPKGAVVFGHNITWPFRWRGTSDEDGEDLEEGVPPSPTLPPTQQSRVDRTPYADSSLRDLSERPGPSFAGESSGSRHTTNATWASTSPPFSDDLTAPVSVESVSEQARLLLAVQEREPDDQVPPSPSPLARGPEYGPQRVLRRERRRLKPG